MSSDARETQIAIAGGGPVGLAVALGLARQGIRSIVFEKARAPAPYARAGVLLARTLEIFRSWGLIDKIRAAAIAPDALHVCDALDDRELIRIDFSLLQDETLEPGCVFLPQHQTEAILREATLSTGLVEIRFGHEVVDLWHESDGICAKIRARDDAGTSNRAGESQHLYDVHAHFLVGADGGDSTVRERLGIPLEGETYPTRVMLAVISIEDSRDALPWPRLRFDRQEYLAALRFSRGRWRVIAALSPKESDEAALARQRIAEHVAATLGEGPFDVEWASAFNIHRRHVPWFSVGRIALAGDAAHLNSPVGGQGLNAGIADAQNLAWKLANALRGGDAMRLLASYDVERRSAIVAGTERFTDRLTKLMLATRPEWRRSLFAAGGRLMRIAPFARRLLRTGLLLDVRYTDSPLFVGKSYWTGRRVPDPELAAIDRATLVVSENARFNFARLTLPAEVGTLIVDGSRARYWKTHAPFAALVRPDGCVGWFAKSPSLGAIERAVPHALGYA